MLAPDPKNFEEFDPSFPAQLCARTRQLNASCQRPARFTGQKNLGANPFENFHGRLLIGARSSPLSRAQVEEIKQEFGIDFDVIWIETTGDRDQLTSLRNMEKSDFFTRELDQMLLEGKIDAAIHSAKDLPDPLPKGLVVAAYSRGVDSRDSLVIKREPVELVATSSERREEAVRKLFPDCKFVDIRGTIEERLKKDVDGVVIAEAALIRLKLTHLKRIFLPGDTAPMQGKIAIVCREHENFIFRAQPQTGNVSLSCDSH